MRKFALPLAIATLAACLLTLLLLAAREEDAGTALLFSSALAALGSLALSAMFIFSADDAGARARVDSHAVPSVQPLAGTGNAPSAEESSDAKEGEKDGKEEAGAAVVAGERVGGADEFVGAGAAFVVDEGVGRLDEPVEAGGGGGVVVGDAGGGESWMGLVEECVELFEELERHKPDFDASKYELADHVTFRLREVLERCGVETIADEASFDRRRHQPEGTVATKVAAGAAVAETLSPGFAVGRRVLRRAKVRLAREPT